MGYFIISLITTFLLACQSSNVLKPIAPEVAPSVTDTHAVTAPDQPIQPRFCNDDIYTQHIREEFTRKNLPKVQANEESFKILRYQLPLEFSGAPVTPSPRVLAWISYFTGRGRSDFLLWLVRSASIQETVMPLLAKEGLPPEFLFLAMIESGFSNYAFSRARAAGAWQFMKPTAVHYGLQVNNWVDERRDPTKSTLAAARYLKDLHRQFGDWYLALAAYNAGPTRVNKAIKAMKTRDYWVLATSSYLRPETRDYVPKLLAALIVASHARTYGFDVVEDIRNKRPNAKLNLYHSYRVDEIANRLGVPSTDLLRWNPELMQGVTPPIHPMGRPFYSLRIPKRLQENWTSIEPGLEKLALSDVLVHRIRRGDTLASIARQYKITVQKILDTNPQLNPKRLRLGQALNVPVSDIQSGSMHVQST